MLGRAGERGHDVANVEAEPRRLDPRANQVRLILHGCAYWLLYALRAAAPSRSPLRRAEFATLRLRLIKIAARVVEGAARIRVWLPTACPDRMTFALLAGRFAAAGP